MNQRNKFSFEKPIEKRLQEFRDIYYELVESCEIYDQGKRETDRKFRNIAGALYILLHDGSKQKSLLRVLGLRDRLCLPDSASLFDPQSFGLPLASVTCPPDPSDRVFFTARKEDCPLAVRKGFGKWWEGAVFSPDGKLRLSRRTLVNVMRSQDGGFGHSDDTINDEAYCYLEQKGAPHFTWYFSKDGYVIDVMGSRIQVTSRNPNLKESPPSALAGPYKVFLGPQATIRQIAWELNVALKDSGVLDELGI
jgi:hypothetical protein